MTLKKLIFGLILLFGFLFSYDEFLTREFTIKDGFVGGTVTDIFQDHHDRIWFCSSEGICIFDAEEFTNSAQSDLLPSSFVECGIEDPLNRVWLGTQSGLVKIENNESVVFTVHDGLPSNDIKTVIFWNKQLWVGTTKGIAVLFESENKFRQPVLDFRMNRVSKFYVDKSDKLWIGSSDGLWILDPLKNINRIKLPEENLKIWEIIDINGVIYVSTEKFTENIQNKYKVFQVHWDLSVSQLQDDLWFKSAVELPKYGFVFSSWNKIIVQKQSFSGISKIAEFPYAWITALFQDREGNTWFGSKNRLFFVNDKNIRIRRNDTDKYALSESVYSTTINGNVVVTGSGEKANGVYFENYKWQKIKNCPTNVSEIQYSKYFGWVVTSENGFLGILDTNSWTVEKCKNIGPLSNHPVIGIADCEKSATILIATNKSIFEYDGNQIDEWKHRNSGIINCISKWNNKIYFGCDKGLFSLCIQTRKLNPIKKDSTSFFSKIVDMSVSDNQTLLVLEDNEGYEFTAEDNYNTLLLPKIKNQKFRSILKHKGHIWINTLASILHLYDENYTIYDIDCGMVTTSNMQWMNDKLWILSHNGVVQISPQVINPYISETIIYSIQDNISIISDSLILPVNVNNVKFRFSLPSFASIGSQKYIYRLLGLNDNWQYSFSTKLEFLNLSPGDYCLEVIGFDRHGKSKERATQVFFTVSESAEFLTLIIILTSIMLLSIIVIATNFFTNRSIKTKLSHQTDKIEICLFNSFTVVKNGQIIPNIAWQGKRSKEILFFLILKDYQHKIGVDIEEFHTQFWPDASTEEVLNRKNVAFSRIRSAVRITDQKVIVLENNRYFFDWTNPVFKIDIIEYNKHINNTKNYKISGQVERMFSEHKKALDIFGNGLTTEFSYNWCDEIYEGMKKEIRDITIEISEEYYQNRDFNKVIYFTRKMQAWDYLDEVAVELEVNSLKRIGKLKEAQVKLEKFKALFLKEIGEESKIEIT
ncbi:MAG: hypothetical protein ISR90_02090 [Candidatus Marinimicrobia bacterium]|nr:hypothetical protein [Candidatus Neomarinimicrobiota bacterium]MBL7022832.1 hypothetical protein [Candidatus Neomarinimicrobiota bacterium]MBL7109447.1 hypothetical protein [Candidatus Neomarinimicrobiota bacterium]